jgi:hypothetical protein
MADITIIEAISLLTKVSADNSKMLKSLTSSGNISGNKKGKEDLVKKAAPVMVTDFGKAAEKDLAKLGGDASKERERADKENNKNKNLLRLLGLAGAAALALKFLFEGEGFTGLVQGFQNVVKRVTNFVSKAKGLIDDIGKKLGTFADDIGKRVGTIVDDVMAKTGTWAAKAKNGIKNAMDDIGRKLGSFGDEIAKGVQKAITSAKNATLRIADATKKAVAGSGDDILKTTAKVAAKTATSGTAAAVTQVANQSAAAPEKPSKPPRKSKGGRNKNRARTLAAQAGKGKGSQVMKKIGGLLKNIKPLSLLKGLLKSPLLAPVVESFLTVGDVRGYIGDYENGEISLEELNNKTGTRLIQSITALIGGAGGAVMGSLLSAPLGPPGMFVGALAGAVLGDVAGRFVGKLIASSLGDNVTGLGEFALSSPLFKVPEVQSAPIDIDDGIILKDGKVIKPDTQDTLYAMKDGGPLFKALDKTPKMIGSLMDVEVDSRNLLREQNLLLKAILEKTGLTPTMVGNTNNNVKNFNQSGDLFRSLQSNY